MDNYLFHQLKREDIFIQFHITHSVLHSFLARDGQNQKTKLAIGDERANDVGGKLKIYAYMKKQISKWVKKMNVL